MADDALCKADEMAWDGKACPLRLLRFDREEIRRPALNPPNHRFWRDAGLGEIASGIPPAFEVVLRCQRNAMSVDHRSFAQHLRAELIRLGAVAAGSGFPIRSMALKAL